jgi:hypothetical protein
MVMLITLDRFGLLYPKLFLRPIKGKKKDYFQGFDQGRRNGALPPPAQHPSHSYTTTGFGQCLINLTDIMSPNIGLVAAFDTSISILPYFSKV